MNDIILKCIESWYKVDNCIYSIEDILSWVEYFNKNTQIDIKKIPLSSQNFWFFDKNIGIIKNSTNSFFSIHGLKYHTDYTFDFEQPIIVQNEIGFLGFICKIINNTLYFLVQAKIEPGNINVIQLSPTIQATKSNFTQKHGGSAPSYLNYFLNPKKGSIIVDQIQSEQSSRFWRKRNRNIIIKIDDDLELLPNYRWMTIGQIKRLMHINNLVNMDTRTVLSCIPYLKNSFTDSELNNFNIFFKDQSFFNSIFYGCNTNTITDVYNYINDFKMFERMKSELVSLESLSTWKMKDIEFSSDLPSPFKIIFCDILIDGREVKKWTQPLFEAYTVSIFGLIQCVKDDILYFLVKAMPECGCHDYIELGPTIQLDSPHSDNKNSIDLLFWDKLNYNENVRLDVLLSEEGGRFYHEQNRNIILEVSYYDLPNPLPDGYFLIDYKTLNLLSQINNIINIQLRNLLSTLEI